MLNICFSSSFTLRHTNTNCVTLTQIVPSHRTSCNFVCVHKLHVDVGASSCVIMRFNFNLFVICSRLFRRNLTNMKNIERTVVTRLRGSIHGRGRNSFSSPPRPDLFWGSPSLVFSVSLPLGWKGRGMRLAHLFSAEDKNAWSLPPFPHTSSWHGT